MQEQICIAGVDVSKAELVICMDDRMSGIQQVPNEAEAIGRWLQKLPQTSIVAMESSGIYHRLLAQLAHSAGFRVYVLNARDVHMYAKAISARAKTDRLDAHVIVRYVRENMEHLRVWKPGAEVSEHLQQLLDRGDKLTDELVKIRQSLRDVPQLKLQLKQLEGVFKDVKAQIDKMVEQLLGQEPKLQEDYRRLKTITGVGLQAGARLSALFSKIEFANADAVIAYSGLDPRANDSGTKRGRRSLSKRGPAALRRQAYMMAMGACNSKLFKPYYEKLRTRFAGTEALVILGRKLLRIAWAVWKSGKTFDRSMFA